MIRVILMTDYSSEYDRRLLRGIMRYSKEHGPWTFYRLSYEYRSGEACLKDLVNIARDWKADAVIGRWIDEELGSLNDLNIPVALLNYRKRSTRYSNITGDYKGTGAMAARYFYDKRYVSFAFVGINGVLWSDERLSGYADEVKSLGGVLHVYESCVNEKLNFHELGQWLMHLPEETAVFCCDDSMALHVTEVCRTLGIPVPERLSVLGVDNDELVCCISDPPISSIELNVEQGGYMLCKRLHQEILHLNSNPFSIVINPIQVIERQSTCACISDPMVKRVVDHIDLHFMENLTIPELIRLVPLSRRSIESKFKRDMGKSIYQYVLDCRIKRASQLLLTTDKSIPQIALECGIQDLDNLSIQFKKRMHCTPKEFRDKFCAF